jgi:transcriptional regulator with XRE-family HTH domain
LRQRKRTLSAKAPGAADAAVGRNVGVYRRAREMTQKALAARLGVSTQQVQKYESGTNRIGSGRLLRIAEVLGVPVEQLFDGTRAAQWALLTATSDCAAPVPASPPQAGPSSVSRPGHSPVRGRNGEGGGSRSGWSPAAPLPTAAELLADAQSLRLARAFARVVERAARRLFVALVEKMAR